MAPLSDAKGRRTVILITFIIYFCANVGLALTRSFAQLAVLRALQSSASASSVAIGAAIVGDVVDRRDRGGYMGIFNAASLLATAVGPVIGGAMAETLGWRSIFWFLVAFGGAFLVLAFFGLPETMRNIVGQRLYSTKRSCSCTDTSLLGSEGNATTSISRRHASQWSVCIHAHLQADAPLRNPAC